MLLALVTALVSAITVLQLTILAEDRGLEIEHALDIVRYTNSSSAEYKQYVSLLILINVENLFRRSNLPRN